MLGKNHATIASGLFLEGLAIDHARDVIWYSDVVGGGIHGVRTEGTALATLNPDRRWTGGVLVNRDGCVLSSGQGGIMWNNPATGASGWLVDRLDGEPVNGINELVPDGTGGIFFGTNDIEMIAKGEAPRSTSLYRLAVDGRTTKLADDIGFTNGIIHDAARRRLYCNDTFHCTWVFDVEDDLSLTNRRVFLPKDDVDGMALDVEGNLWITGFRSRYISRVTPDGKELARIEAAGEPVTQLRFAGPDMRDCYYNSVPNDAGETLKNGGTITAANSHLYRFRAPVAGVDVGTSEFALG